MRPIQACTPSLCSLYMTPLEIKIEGLAVQLFGVAERTSVRARATTRQYVRAIVLSGVRARFALRAWQPASVRVCAYVRVANGLEAAP
jgi:hypothetical protein